MIHGKYDFDWGFFVYGSGELYARIGSFEVALTIGDFITIGCFASAGFVVILTMISKKR